jgi:AraC family transcriptional regulator, transcriptional activator of pobA
MEDEFGLLRRIRAEVLEPALAERSFRLGSPSHRWFVHLVFLKNGRLGVSGDDDLDVLEGPSLLVAPPSQVRRLRLAAGSRCYIMGASMDVVADAIGDYPESSAIRQFIGRSSTFNGLDAEQCRLLEQPLQGLVQEMQGPVSHMAVSAHLRLLLLWAWRNNTPDEPAVLLSMGGITLLQQFRQLVEAEFRHHRPISYYAQQLGISMDRLHAVCSRNLNRAPIALLHERLTQEARIRLERSDRTVREISDSLGFKDPAHFSHFFKGKTGLSPARYRRSIRQVPTPSSAQINVDYHDWP